MKNSFFFLLCFFLSIHSQSFVISDVSISDPSQSLPDPEIDWVGNHVCWADEQGVWVAEIDKQTGDFVPKNGRGHLLDSTPSYRGFQAVKNGPEWAMSRNGSVVVYPDSVDATNICAGTGKLVNGQWIASRLPKSDYRIPFFGSYDETYEKDGISCASYGPSGETGARLRNTSDTVEIAVSPAGMAGNRWIKGKYAVSLSKEKQAPYEAGMFDVETKTYTKIAVFYDPVDQSWIVPLIEKERRYALFCVVKKVEQDEIAIFTESNNVWSKSDSIRIPTDRKEIHSPEPFWWRGKAYIFLVTRPRDGQPASLYDQVWIAGLAADNRLIRMVSAEIPANRTDPEVFYTNAEPVIYYTETRQGRKIIHKCATGLSHTVKIVCAEPLRVESCLSVNYTGRFLFLNDINTFAAPYFITGINGRVVSHACADNDNIDVSSLRPGAYFVKLCTGDITRPVHKFIKN